jgi:PAS domain S-box-containing protein
MLSAIALLRWLGQEWGLYGHTVGVVLLTAAAIVVIAGLMWHFAAWLDRNETTREDAEEALRHSSRHFELSSDMLCTAGFDGVFRELNAAWTTTLGWSRDELRSRPYVEFVHPDDRERTERETAGLSRGGITVDFVNRYATKDGGWRWIDWKSMAVAEDELIYASARDVTQRTETEAALEGSERRARQIVETAHDAFIGMDAQGAITDWNPEAERSFGWSREEALGRELAETVIPERHREGHRRGLERFLATGETRMLGKRLELSGLHRDGREFPIELTISAVETAQGHVFHAFMRDITERVGARELLSFARDEALEASRMKSMFVANVSHEIRTPMNGVIGMGELLLDTELDVTQREYAETICASGESLLTLIDDILDFSKMEAGKLELDRADFDLRETIERPCTMLAARAHEQGLELAVEIDAGVPERVFGDAARLRQVISNLVSNAIKFTSEGEVVVRASATPGEGGTTLLRIAVSDTGIGIAAEALDELFDPYSQADGSTTRRYGGTGLGLSISRQLVELMGGTVNGESEPGTGSRFWFELPLEPAALAAGGAVDEREVAGLRILVVDDNETNREILKRQLGTWRMSCDVAASARSALALLEAAAARGTPYALALLDLNMPDVDGLALAGAIRANPALRDVRLLLLSSSGARPGESAEYRCDGWLTKPVRQSRLHDEIQRVLAGDAPLMLSPAPGPRTAHAGAVARVLVVEDAPVNQLVAVRMLKRCGYMAEVAENGRVALDMLAERSFAAVLMDCQMPVLDGYETTRELRRRERGGPRTAIIAMTANSMQHEREKCLAAGMDDYLAKPLRTHTLEAALARLAAVPDPGTPASESAVAAGAAEVGPELLDTAVLADLKALGDAVVTDLRALYFDEAARHMADLAVAVERDDAQAVAHTAHKLKGGSGSMGAARVSWLVERLETTANDGDVSAACERLGEIRAVLEETRQALLDSGGGPAARAPARRK